MLLKYVFSFLAFMFGIALADDDVLKGKFSLPDSVCRKKFEFIEREKLEELLEKSKELQRQSEMMMEKYREMIEKSEELQKRFEELKKRLEKGDLKMIVVPKFVDAGKWFDDTGLIVGNKKYFIRIWKHPPKEFFNMPTLPMK